MFTHLHLHTEYSLLDGACRMPQLFQRAKALGYTHLAITDHGVMYGVVDFYKEALKQGIQPIIGCEVYVAPGDRQDKSVSMREYAHLILLAENQIGYKNLTQLVTQGFTEGFYYKPRIDYELLRAHSEGLICLSACLSGDIPRYLLQGNPDAAEKLARKLRALFGPEHFYIELQDHGIPEQKQVNPLLIALAKSLDIPMVVTNDVHYIQSTDAEAQDVLMCIQTGKTVEDEDRMRMSTDQLYLKSEAEMRRLFPQCPEAYENTQRIAERCHVDFDFHTLHLPKYDLPAGVTGAQALRDLCEAALPRLYPHRTLEVEKRLDYELSVIESMGYIDYFLIVWDFIRFAREKNIPVGPGRGSAAGSIVAYLLGITGLDPLRYQLIFERFLNPERISMPDIDIDFCYERRQEVIDYVVQKYGQDRVAQIITFGTMAARAVIRDTARALNLPYALADSIAKMVPFALDMTLDKALEQSAELRDACESDPRIQRLLDLARALEGMPRHASTHAAGVVISAKPLTDYLPLQLNEDVLTTQFPMGTIEELGLLKMDFLGLRTLTVLRDTQELLAARGIAIDLDNLPEDPEVYRMLGQGDTDGVFQLESSGMRQVLRELGPTCLEDIIAVISLYRPGPMESIPRYIAGKNDPATVTYRTPLLEPILSVTYGCMVYQEQVMQMVRDVAGYSYGRSDLVRRAMSKKKKDVMEKERQAFIYGVVEDGVVLVPGAVRNGVSVEAAGMLFDEMTAFAQYAFNKSHAAAYAFVAYQTAYMKLHYPVEFMAALLNSILGNSDKVAGYIQTCRHVGFEVLPPNVNKSSVRFSVEGRNIRFGLGAIKNVGFGSVRAILRARETGGPFRDFFDFIERVEADAVGKRVVESLIKAGAFDGLEGTRAQLLAVYEQALDGMAQDRKRNVFGQLSLFSGLEEDLGGELRPPLPAVPDLPTRVRLTLEKETTGIFITGHPLDEFRPVLNALPINTRTLGEWMEEEDAVRKYDGSRAFLGGMVAEKRLKATRKGDLMAFVQLEDLMGMVEVLIFPRVLDQFQGLLYPESFVLLDGRFSVREEDTPKFICESVYALEKTKLVHKLYLRCDLANWEALRALLTGAGAGSLAHVYCFDGTVTRDTGIVTTLDASRLEALYAALGRDNVRVVEKVQPAE